MSKSIPEVIKDNKTLMYFLLKGGSFIDIQSRGISQFEALGEGEENTFFVFVHKPFLVDLRELILMSLYSSYK